MALPPVAKPNVVPMRGSSLPEQRELVPSKPPARPRQSPEASAPKSPPAKLARHDAGADDLSASRFHSRRPSRGARRKRKARLSFGHR
eukprot:7851637-Pyramimonas_sp.AAC.1